jgi:hypothetical protein
VTDLLVEKKMLCGSFNVWDSVFAVNRCRVDSPAMALPLERRVSLMRCLF